MKLWQYLKDRFTSYVAPTHEEVVEAKLVGIVDRIIAKGYAGNARHDCVHDIVKIRILFHPDCSANLDGKPSEEFWNRVDVYINELTDRTRSQ